MDIRNKSAILLLTTCIATTSIYATSGFVIPTDSYRDTVQRERIDTNSTLFTIKDDYADKIKAGSTNPKGEPVKEEKDDVVSKGEFGEEINPKKKIPANQTVKIDKVLMDKMIRYILSKEGNNYSWGGSNVDILHDPKTYSKKPVTDGADCVGLIIAAYKFIGYEFEFGKVVSHDVNKLAGKTVKQSEMKQGDILYFTHGHTALYIGDGKVINAEGSDTEAGKFYVRKLKGGGNQYYLWDKDHPVANVRRVFEVE